MMRGEGEGEIMKRYRDWETIVDEKRFIEAHTATIERNKDNKYFQSYQERLKKIGRAHV